MDKVQAASKLKGTFLGVFLPCFLSFMSIVYFLRLNFLSQTYGPVLTILAIALATLIVLFSCFSIASIATNERVGSGGIFTILSRTFGLEAGSAIAMPLLLAQCINVAFCGAALSEVLSFLDWRLVRFGALAFLTVLTGLRASFISRLQLIVFSMIAISIGYLFVSSQSSSVTLDFPDVSQFWIVFAIFFPALTGVEVALAVSEELKNPLRSIPFGTIGAIALCFLVFVFTAIFIESMPASPLLIATISGATLTGALSSLISSSRLLQSFAKDRVVPKYLGGRAAPFVVALVAGVALLLPGLDQIALILTLFFLLSYGMLNFASAIQGFLLNPSFRPTFRTHWLAPFCGFVLCSVASLMVSPGSTLTALAIIILIYMLFKKRGLRSNFQDMRRSILLFLSRFALYKLAQLPVSDRCWRPNLLLFAEDPKQSETMLMLSSALAQRKGLLAITTESTSLPAMHRYVRKNQILAFVDEQCPANAMLDRIRTYGIGELTPNLIVAPASKGAAKLVRTAHLNKKNVMLVRGANLSSRLAMKEKLKKPKVIDIWWGGLTRKNSQLMLILAHMLQSSREWHNTIIQLKTLAYEGDDPSHGLSQLDAFAKNQRFQIVPRLVWRKKGDDFFQKILLQSSKEADLVLLGLKVPSEKDTEESYGAYLDQLLESTPTLNSVAYVLANEGVNFDLILN